MSLPPCTSSSLTINSIISQVLHWDIRELESRASKLEKERAQIGKDQLKYLKEYPSRPIADQDRIRKRSQQESISIVSAILQETKLEWQLTEPHHKQALEYLSIHLSIRDRKEIINVLCHSRPDYLTDSVRDLVAAYEPVIRKMHSAVNLSGTVGDLESFLHDMIKLAKIQADRHGHASVPTVGDFIMLLRKHQFSTHTFIHQVCKNGPELTNWYLAWAKQAAGHFQRQDAAQTPDLQTGAGDLTPAINELFASLPEDEQKTIIPILDAELSYLDELHASSLARLQSVISSPASKNPAIAKILTDGPPRSNSRSPMRHIPLGHSHSRHNSQPSSRKASPERSPISPTVAPDFKDPDAPTPKVSPPSIMSLGHDILPWSMARNNLSLYCDNAHTMFFCTSTRSARTDKTFRSPLILVQAHTWLDGKTFSRTHLSLHCNNKARSKRHRHQKSSTNLHRM